MEFKPSSFPRACLLATVVWLTCVAAIQAAAAAKRNAGKCPPGSFYYERDFNCISLHDDAKTWADARSFCKQRGGFLLSLYDAHVNDFFVNVVLKAENAKDRYWIGLRNHFEADGWEGYRWLDDEFDTYFTYWPKGNVQPANPDKNTYCAYVKGPGSYLWEVMGCDAKLPFACETWTEEEGDLSCPDDYELYYEEGRCYKAVDEYRTWHQARDACRKEGGDLATVRTPEINAFLVHVLPPKGSFWIGLSDRKEEGEFRWLDEDAGCAFTNWIDGEPNDSEYNGGEDCTAIIAPHRGRWNDFPCDSRTRYICERWADVEGFTRK